jgi:sulfate adenylyltransferase
MAMAAAREENCSIFLQPPVGMPAPGDVDHFTQVCCCREFTAFFPQNLIALGLLTYAARHAGPREALLQALIRRNYGCTHFMVAEDHADPFAWRENSERFYPTSTAQELVAKHAAETGVGMLPLRRMVYCEERAQYIPADEACRDLHVKELTSTELQRRLEFGLEIPEWFTFPEVAAQLAKTYPPRHKQGFTVFITGLSGAGKSTLAKVLYVKFQEMRDRPVTLLDGDIVRRNLSSELNFSREHRDLNVRRIGFVASEITKNRGIAICAPIAPYAGSRRHNRELISHYGGYVEVFLCTPLSVCETRDRKGIYAKARAGIMKGVTGIDDPYQAPSNADIVLDTSSITPLQAAQEVLLYLSKHGYIKNE